MLDINFVRENPDKIQKNADFRRVKVSVTELLKLDEKRRGLITQIEGLRAMKNQKSNSKPSEAEIEKLRAARQEIQELEKKLKTIEIECLDKLSRIPNMSAPDMPEGEGDPDHVEIAAWTPEDGYFSKDKLGIGEN